MSKPIADRIRDGIQSRPYTFVIAAFFVGVIIGASG
jgi:hypothetical protein